MPSIWRPPTGAALVLLLALHVASVGTAAAQGPVTYRTDRLLVRFTPGLTAALPAGRGAHAIRRAVPTLDAVARASGVIGWQARFPRALGVASGPPEPLQSFWLAELAPGTDADAAAARLRDASGVVSVERIAIVPVTAIPNDSLWANATHLYQASRRDVHAPEAWDVTRGDPRIVVAILDTGIIPYHPDLSGDGDPALDRLWRNEMEANGLPGVDDDGNGYVDDVAGWDFVSLPDSTDVVPGEDWRDEDGDPNDFAGHGTAVAGMVSAIPDNGIGAAGLGWNVRVMALRMGWAHVLAPLGVVDMSDAAAAIDYATRMGAHVINCSFATVTQSDFTAAVDAAVEAGVLIVTSAGNNNSPNSLAHRPDVLAVTATDVNDAIPPFATTGPYVDLAAPGLGLPTASIRRTGSDSLGLRQPWYTTGASGTSFSAPLVSAAAALMQSHELEEGRPLLAREELQLRIVESTDDINSANPGRSGFGTGRLNVERALSRRGSFVVPTGSATVGPFATIETWGGERRIIMAMRSGHLLILSAQGDTLALTPLPGIPASGISVGDGGDDSGPALFLALEPGLLASYAADGRPREGWPVEIGLRDDGIPVGPAIADLDGDGTQEVVWGDPFSNIAVWRMNGERFPGFPLRLDNGTMSPIVALADIDGQPGAEIVAGTGAPASPVIYDFVHVVRFQGSSINGWPVRIYEIPRTIGVTYVGQPPRPRIYAAGGDRLSAIHGGGVRHFDRSLGGNLAHDMAIADMNGDGWHEVVLGLTNGLDVFDDNGSRVLGWPGALGETVGPPLIGPLEANASSAILVAIRNGADQLRFQGLSINGLSIPGFPKPGTPGPWPELLQLDDDETTEFITGADESGLVYFYEAPPARWSDQPQWPTARANLARTSCTEPVTIPKLDEFAPRAPEDFQVLADSGEAMLAWQAASDVGPRPFASRYELFAAPFELTEANVETAPMSWRVPAQPGAEQRNALPDLDRSEPLWLTVRAVDAAGNVGPIGNVEYLEAVEPVPPVLVPGMSLTVLGQPASSDVHLRWYSVGGTSIPRITIFDVTGRVVRRIEPGPGYAGEYWWDRRDDGGVRVPAGLYFATMKDGVHEERSRIVLLR